MFQYSAHRVGKMRQRLLVTSVLVGSIIHISASFSWAVLFLHYKFDGDAVDAVAGRNGTLLGNATFSNNAAPGIGSAMSLALDGSLDKVIYDTTAADNVTGTFTVALWVNAQEQRPSAALTFFGTRGPSDTFGTDLKYFIENYVRADIGTGTGFLTINDSPFVWNLNEWHHFAAVVTPSQYQLYIDGNLYDTDSYSGVPLLLDAGHNLAVGAVADLLVPHGEDFHGLIDDFRIYKMALTAGEVATLLVPEPSTAVTTSALCCVGLLNLIACRFRTKE
jgi:hypothetical protein